MPRFVLEYLEAGAEDEATLRRERDAFAEWRFRPRQLVDVSKRSLTCKILGKAAEAPIIVAPTGLNGLFTHHGDLKLAQGATAASVPFVLSTMSNDAMEDIAAVEGVRFWWQLYVFGDGDRIWRALLDRAERANAEALVVTTNCQIYGNREWDSRTRATRTRPSIPTILDAGLHPGWLTATLLAHGMPKFKNALEFVPEDKRGFFDCAFWIREHQPTSLDWETIRRIRDYWKKPLILKGLLHPEDVRRARSAGVDAVVLSSHGGRQLDWTVAGLDVLPEARAIAGDRMAVFVAGGLRRGTDLLKALALGADAVFAGRAPLYGLCAGGAAGVTRALEILKKEALDAMGLLGAPSLEALGPDLLCRVSAPDSPAPVLDFDRARGAQGGH
ncbi:MAG TPA: alpha-hydroxy acid oxidase [Caulobacteraceae bacterium]|jgi:(S)-mandelate dehydrogenase|nr:alpha-hydroxy acid oxidase [Caulobacteraceae bacterium]